MPSTSDSHPSPSVVIAIDIGSSSVRALLFDEEGSPIDGSEVQLPYRQVVTADGGSESSPEELLERVCACIDGVLAFGATEERTIVGVGATSFWHGLLGLDASGSAITPVFMWSDKRSGRQAETIAAEFDARAIHQRVGCRIHSSYWPAKIRWLRETDSATANKVAHWVSITDFIMLRLTGELMTSISMASGTGLLNSQSLTWDGELLEALSIDPDTLPKIVDRTDPYPPLLNEFSERWPQLAGVPWYPAIGDGAAANVGSGCVVPGRMAMTIGTSAAMRLIVSSPQGEQPVEVPDRIWRYRLDRDLAVVGGALSNGGNAAAWVAEHSDTPDLGLLSEGAAAVFPDGHGLTMLPLFAGERSPSWNEHATATIHGMRLATTSVDLFRATLEACSYRLAAIHDDLAPLAASEYEIHANGAAALGSPLWLQIIADTLGHQVDAVDAEMEASARGAAICALQASGVIDDLLDTGRPVATSYHPSPDNHEVYAAARQRQARLESLLDSFSDKDQTTP